MTRLRKRMLEELQRRDYSHSTARIYLHVISDFARHFRRSPDMLGLEHIRQYQLHLFHKKLSPYTIRQHTAALRFFFFKTLHRNFRAEYIPKFRKRLPTILSPEEVGRLIDSAHNLFHRTLIMTLYSTAMRRAELCRLHPPRRHFQSSLSRLPARQRDLSLQGLHPWQQETPDDSILARVLTALPAPRSPPGIRPHSFLRLPGQSTPSQLTASLSTATAPFSPDPPIPGT